MTGDSGKNSNAGNLYILLGFRDLNNSSIAPTKLKFWKVKLGVKSTFGSCWKISKVKRRLDPQLSVSDRKTISQRLFTFFIWFEIHIQPFFNPTNGLNIWTVRCSSHCVDCSFKSTKKIELLYFRFAQQTYNSLGIVYFPWPIHIL